MGIRSTHTKPGKTSPLTSFDDSSVSYRDFDSEQNVDQVLMEQYKLYPQRWFVLASYGLLLTSNQWMWAIWSPLTAPLAEYWNLPESDVDALSGVYMYVYVPTNILFMWLVVNCLGLARGVQLGAFLNWIGASIMYGWPKLLINSLSWNDYHIKYLGVFVCGLAQSFMLPLLALVSANWFGEEERATATSLGTFSVQFGTLLGLGSTLVVDFREDTTGLLDPNKLDTYLQLHWIIAFVALAAIVVTFAQDRPPTPPSQAAAALAQNKSLDLKYMDSVRLVLASPSSRTFFLLFGLAIGCLYSIPAFLSQFMPDWPPRHQGMLGAIFQIAAVAGCFAVGKLLSWFHLQYKKISVFLLGGCLVSTILYLISVKYQSYLAMVACAGMGFFFASFMSVGIEFGTALTFPADEGAVYGLLDCTGELSGFLLVLVGGAMSDANLEVWFCASIVAMVSLAFVMLWRLEPLVTRPSLMTPSRSSSDFVDPIASFGQTSSKYDDPTNTVLCSQQGFRDVVAEGCI